MTTETGWLVGMVEDLLPAAGGEVLHGDDAEEHTLAFDFGDGITESAFVRWSCHCGAWSTEDATMANFDVARAFLHHVYPSRYTARPSTIMTEVLRSVHQDRRQ